MELKNIKGLTLVEILVSIVITILVMTYGLNLFIASWRLGSDSEDYDMVLHYVMNEVERVRSESSYTDLGNTNEDITLSSGKIVNIQRRVYSVLKDGANAIDVLPVAVIATWPKNAQKNEKIEHLVVHCFVGRNESDWGYEEA